MPSFFYLRKQKLSSIFKLVFNNQYPTIMRNQTSLPQGAYAEMHAKQAIEIIMKWVDQRYPVLSTVSKSRLITQCLIEIREERRDMSYLN